jgi:hypothetical protein
MEKGTVLNGENRVDYAACRFFWEAGTSIFFDETMNLP